MIDSFKTGVIVFVDTIENVRGEFRVTKGLTNVGKCICRALNFVEEIGDSIVTLFKLRQLSKDSHGT
jgi:hypothetical protein